MPTWGHSSKQDPGCLPAFIGGQSPAVHVEAWMTLERRCRADYFRQAAIAWSLKSAAGKRTDVDGEATSVQEFCEHLGIGTSYFWEMVRVFEVFRGPHPPGRTEILENRHLNFKHFRVAANGGVLPWADLREAIDKKWPANELARQIAQRKSVALISDDGALSIAADDNNDAAEGFLNLPQPHLRKTSRALRVKPIVVHLEMRTLDERAACLRKLRRIAIANGTKTDHATWHGLIDRGSREWGPVETPARRAAARSRIAAGRRAGHCRAGRPAAAGGEPMKEWSWAFVPILSAASSIANAARLVYRRRLGRPRSSGCANSSRPSFPDSTARSRGRRSRSGRLIASIGLSVATSRGAAAMPAAGLSRASGCPAASASGSTATAVRSVGTASSAHDGAHIRPVRGRGCLRPDGPPRRHRARCGPAWPRGSTSPDRGGVQRFWPSLDVNRPSDFYSRIQIGELRFAAGSAAGRGRDRSGSTADTRRFMTDEVRPTCGRCGNAFSLGISCTGEIMPDGKTPAIRYGLEQPFVAGVPVQPSCHDCGVRPGGLHHLHCDVEQCARCGGQLLGGCSCWGVLLR